MADETGTSRRAEARGAEATGVGLRRQGVPPPAAPNADQTQRGARRGRVTSSLGPPATGPTESREPSVDDVVRFGPGITAAEAPSAPAWKESTSATRRRRRRRRPWVGGLLTLLIVAGVLAYLLSQQSGSVGVTAVRVAAQPAAARCDTTVDVVGTVTTDGRSGAFRYRWERSDGQTTQILTQTVARGETTTQVHLQWSVSGRGAFGGRATLRILESTPAAADGTFTYACP